MSENTNPNGRKNPDGSITSAFAQRNFREVRDMVKSGPVKVTIHGKPEMIILSRQTYESLTRGAPVSALTGQPPR